MGKHPNGYRIVAGAPNKAGSITLQDSPGGKVYELPMKAKRNEESGQVTVDMDLSEYKPDNPQYASIIATVTEDGCILFPDGNLWKKDKGVAGLYIDGFAPYPKYRRIVIPTNKGKNVAVTMVSGKSTFQVDGVETKKGVTVVFPGDKTCTGKFDQKEGIITWLDGNVWTKV